MEDVPRLLQESQDEAGVPCDESHVLGYLGVDQHTHTHARTRTHARRHARTHARTHTHTHRQREDHRKVTRRPY